jgi:uncharacterized membrane protein (DUF106 family)
VETVIVTLLAIITLLLLFFGYALYVTNVKIEEYQKTITTIDKNITSLSNAQAAHRKDLLVILSKIAENSV